MKITKEDRAEWNARDDTSIEEEFDDDGYPWQGRWLAHWHVGNTRSFARAKGKSATISAAIRAERKAKGRR